ncbi:TetR/AcrR family transcriptional regulator [Gallibacter sp. Marseille-QA0791]|uniref:TetR/AcrR family transcriptional regulator n=1 Tax=Gallibacter sp. Marseille-QA0791 TaxID=3378781 RepID=UPI003D0ACA62
MKRKNDTNTKDRILEEAIKLFRERGYDNVTVMQICDAAGITKRTFYYHYKSKDELISGVTDLTGVRAEKLISAMVNRKTNLGILWEIIHTYSRNTINMGPDLTMQVYISGFRSGKKGNFPQDTHMFDTAVQIIENARDSGEISNPANARDMAFILYDALRGITITWAAENGNFDLDAYYLKTLNTVLGSDYAPDEDLR